MRSAIDLLDQTASRKRVHAKEYRTLAEKADSWEVANAYYERADYVEEMAAQYEAAAVALRRVVQP